MTSAGTVDDRRYQTLTTMSPEDEQEASTSSHSMPTLPPPATNPRVFNSHDTYIIEDRNAFTQQTEAQPQTLENSQQTTKEAMLRYKHQMLHKAHLAREAERHANDLEAVHKNIKTFWGNQREKMGKMTCDALREASRSCELPMARVKKIMKIDDDMMGQMISQDAPLFLSKAAEMFIEEITLKAWANTEEMRRKTLQKNDISNAVTRNEHFDFLIDIVPREEAKPPPTKWSQNSALDDQRAYVVGNLSDVAGVGGAVQYVVADPNDPNLGNLMFQLENGQFVSATPIGNPIPLAPEQARMVGGGGPNSHTVRLAPPNYVTSPQVQFVQQPQDSRHVQ